MSFEPPLGAKFNAMLFVQFLFEGGHKFFLLIATNKFNNLFDYFYQLTTQ